MNFNRAEELAEKLINYINQKSFDSFNQKQNWSLIKLTLMKSN